MKRQKKRSNQLAYTFREEDLEDEQGTPAYHKTFALGYLSSSFLD